MKRRYIGKSVERFRDPFFVTGRGKFVSDFCLPGMLHAAILRSPYAYARINKIDTKRASRHPGVVAVLTGTDVAKLSKPIPFMYSPTGFGSKTADVYALATDCARYVGEPVAVVAAENKHAAHEALQVLEVDYTPLTPVVDAEKALEPSSPLVYEPWGDNLLLKMRFTGGDVDRAFKEADYVIKDTLKSHRYTGVPIEPRAYVADYDRQNGAVTLYATTQQPHPLRTTLAAALSMPENSIRVIQPDVGGAFGVKTPPFQEEILLALLSVVTKRPVRWVEERRENFLAGGHAREMVHHFEVAFKKDGRVIGLKEKMIADTGAPSPLIGWGMAFVGALHIPGVYKIENVDVESLMVVTNKAPWNAYRGYGKENSNLLMERCMDMVARKLGMSPIDVRLKNFVQPHEFPFKQISGQVLDSGDYPTVLNRLLQMSQYDKLREERARLRKEGKYVGIGVAFEVAPGGACLPDSYITGYDGTTVRVAPTGQVTVLTGITSPGTGNETMIAQVVADELGIEIGDVSVVQGDTDKCPYGLGNFSDRSTIVGASSAMLAARDIREKVLKVAGSMLEASPDDLDVEESKISVKGVPSKFLKFSDVAQAIYRRPYDCAIDIEPGLEATRYFRTPNATHIPDEQGRISTYPSYPNMAHLAFVEVDIETGEVKILKYAAVHDCGYIMNPMMVEGQLHGGIVQGIGGALYEHLVYDDAGQLLTTTFMDYPIPTSMEVPKIEAANHETRSPFTPYGTKGVGESGPVGAPAVLISAVEDALSILGVKITELPLKPNRVWELIKEAKKVKVSP
ncbi:MAG: xanthine dehydrogenase family protein molybdopterin-binding subunit [Thaumarchaeota archaeon]|nr:xanthine dehydrogenase family protein molybdopterin-binding subunit [Nitrososphaerota archaeon]